MILDATRIPLIEKFGSAEVAVAELQVAAQGIATNAYQTGAWVSVKVQGIPVAISGAVVDGVFRIGSIAKKAF